MGLTDLIYTHPSAEVTANSVMLVDVLLECVGVTHTCLGKER